MINEKSFTDYLNTLNFSEYLKQYLLMCVKAEDPEKTDIQNKWRSEVIKGTTNITEGTKIIIKLNSFDSEKYKLLIVNNSFEANSCNFINSSNGTIFIGTMIGELTYSDCISLEDVYWIPTQSDLQKILINDLNSFKYDDKTYFEFIQWIAMDVLDPRELESDIAIISIKEYKFRFKSISALWLAFYMFKKFRKVWGQEDHRWDWIKIYSDDYDFYNIY